MAKKIAVLMGGQSFERDFSLASGKNVCEALKQAGHEVVALDTSQSLVETLEREKVDAAYIALHGKHGEDGTIQSLLELLGIPYVGSTPNVCRLSWFKPMLPHLLSEYGQCCKTGSTIWPQSLYLARDAFKDMGAANALTRIEGALGTEFPFAVKPACGGSALGIHKVETFEDLAPAILDAFSYDQDVLIQKWIEGTELALSVVERKPGYPEVLAPVEIMVHTEFFNTDARLDHDMVDYYSPARLESFSLDADKAEAFIGQVKDAVLATYAAFCCRDLARVDAIWDGKKLNILEIGVSPGMTEFSLFPSACAASGYELGEVLSDLIKNAIDRDKEAGN